MFNILLRQVNSVLIEVRGGGLLLEVVWYFAWLQRTCKRYSSVKVSALADPYMGDLVQWEHPQN